jgi:hypothetical protein
MITSSDLEIINDKIPKNYLWDGFWINDFQRNRLVISASFDRIYYRNLSLIFKKVTFFNLPRRWDDTDFVSEQFLQLATKEEFEQQHPDFDLNGQQIIKIELNLPRNHEERRHITFFIVCDEVRIYHYENENNGYNPNYLDPLEGQKDVDFMQNRVPLLKKINVEKNKKKPNPNIIQ